MLSSKYFWIRANLGDPLSVANTSAAAPGANLDNAGFSSSAINIRRRSLYVDLGRRRGVTPQVAGYATGCELLTRVPVGEAYMLQDGIWRRHQAGQVIAQPSYCG